MRVLLGREIEDMAARLPSMQSAMRDRLEVDRLVFGLASVQYFAFGLSM